MSLYAVLPLPMTMTMNDDDDDPMFDVGALLADSIHRSLPSRVMKMKPGRRRIGLTLALFARGNSDVAHVSHPSC